MPIFLSLPPRGTIVLACALALLAAPGRGAEPARSIDFNREIRPILSNTCFACHGPDPKARKGTTRPYRLDTEAGAFADLGGYTAIVKGDPDASELVRRITSDDPLELMPPKKHGKPLAPREIALLVDWVRQGAPYARHWSYVAPVRPPLPAVRNPAWPRNPIDSFLLARLDREGLQPSPEADKSTLIRRVALDLTGLPPTLDEVDRFVADTRPDAYEALVARLLDSPAYGEHWARLWLDLARYADSAGYADDPPRTIWAYRDYVIRALNANLPFDRFTIEQIAGDLLPDPTDDQWIATAFHRNTLTNNEGGTNDEEFRNVAVVDRVNTTMAVWMGTTIACAQCHDHKYDPLTQEEFFRLFALFNNTEDADRRDESPLFTLESPTQKRRKAELAARIAPLESALQAARPDLDAGQELWDRTFAPDPKTPAPILALLKTAPEARTAAQRATLATYYRANVAPELKAERDRLARLKAELAALKPETTVPIQRERAVNARRKTRIQLRGNYLDLGAEVTEGVPAAFPPLPEGVARDRLALARWLVSEANPLTARVIVNRFWEQLFGIGIVPTSEEFGAQGEQPTHPELLDWLATELVRERWDMKRFLTLLVTSAAYRQDSKVTPALLHRDPENRLLAAGPRFRLSAEMIRDQALAVSGLLSARAYGPPVKPPQPASGLSAAFGGGIDWQTSAGADRYRRGLYTTWRRSNPYPSMTTFDAPNRDVCTLRRTRTNTPLQALVTLNDPVFVEAAQALARRIVREGGSTIGDRARHGFRLCLARAPHPDELDRLAQLYEAARAPFETDPARARQLATDPLGPAPPGVADADLAAWTVVANVLFNLDEFLMKR